MVSSSHISTLQRIFERRVAGVSYKRIALKRTADGIPRPSGGQPWRHSSIDQIRRDSAYMGPGLWGRQMVVRTESGRRTVRPRDEHDGAIKVHNPPIVSPDLWVAANRVTNCGERHPVRASVESYLLRNVVRCTVVRCTEHNRIMCGSAAGSERARRYVCTCLLVTGKRITHQVPSWALDQAVWADVRAFLDDATRGRRAHTH